MKPHEPNSCERLEHDAVLADLARPLVHEFNNLLNSLLLQIAILQAKSPEAELAGLAPLRKEARRIAGFLQEWQSLPRLQPDEQLIDLNQIVKDVVPGSLAIALQLGPEPLWVRSSVWELRRLCSLLLQACASGADERGVAAQTERQAGHAVLTLRCPGADWPPEALEDAFNLSDQTGCGLVLAGCKNLADRLHGQLAVQSHPDGGVLITFALPAAP